MSMVPYRSKQDYNALEGIPENRDTLAEWGVDTNDGTLFHPGMMFVLELRSGKIAAVINTQEFPNEFEELISDAPIDDETPSDGS